MISHPDLRDYVICIAEDNKIPFQYEALPFGGTDAGSVHNSGVRTPSLAITIATRYIHSHAAIIHEDDFTYTVDLLVKILQQLDWATVKKIRGF
ncbi:hypothetical protein [Peribacillus alkalitolerans]|uniref:hypothetical protein n=1 Tax=Peribacillus alkalitolerans TaxID=1550385 RepID=UPI001F0755D0|nr:hypothetical protein [Peribacillus alkalitolerans]